MKVLPLVCALAGGAGVLAQVSVDEPSTRAHLVEGKTTVSLALRNSSPQSLDARVELQWLGSGNEKRGFERQSVLVPPGRSSVEIKLPLSEISDPLMNRLQYNVFPGDKNYTAFLPLRGILNLVDIADYGFALGVVTADLPQPGKPYEIRVLTFHPTSGQPVAGVTVKSGKFSAISNRDGVALLRVDVEPDEDEPEFEIKAHIGDFHQDGETTPLVTAKGNIHIYTDKPLYQPGQTMHVRILAVGGDRAVRSDVEHTIHITADNGELAHAATVTTSRFGIAWTDWEIPANAKSGEYKIEVRCDDYDYPFSRTVNVRRYDLHRSGLPRNRIVLITSLTRGLS
jgi:hypothetical protein